MAKIAVIVDRDFEDIEYTQPVQAFRQAGHQIVNVGLRAGERVEGKKEHTPVTIDRAVREVRADEFDALFIPGGYSPDHLRAYDEAVQFTRTFVQTGKPTFAICHGAQLLINADVLRGRQVTGWKSIAVDLRNAGAHYLDQEVVLDGNLVSSRGPKDLPAFTRNCLEQLR